MKKTLLSIITFTTLSFGATAQNVNIPDANFKAYLVGNSAINTNADTEIQVSEAVAYTQSIDCSGLGISDLTGIEEFTNLTQLNFFGNNISTLNISANSNLTLLNCGDNNLTNIDVSGILGLSNLNVSLNSLTYLDLSSNINLNSFFCIGNDLEILNMKNISTSTLTSFFATSNPNLNCIDVDDVSASTIAWTNIDAGVSYSLNCQVDLVTSIGVQGQGGSATISTQGGTLQMEAHVLPTYADDDTYTWSVTNGTGSASINTAGLLTALTDGTVTVTATANDASGVTGSAVITISNQGSVGINEQNDMNSLTIFPNPATHQLNLKFKEGIEKIVIRNIEGKAIKTVVPTNNTIDISDLSKGIYLLLIQTEKGQTITKFVKE